MNKGGPRCTIPTPEIKTLASYFGKSERLMTTLVNLWQIANNLSPTTIPTKDLMNKYLSSRVPPEITYSTTGDNRKGWGYETRTRDNAAWSDITIALAEDLNSPGEKLTAEAAGAEVIRSDKTRKDGSTYTSIDRVVKITGKYVPVDIRGKSVDDIADSIEELIRSRNLPTDNIKLNIAGNSIANLVKDLEDYDELVTEVIAELLNRGITILEIRSGGQSGIDESGAKAGVRLGIKTHIHAPGGFRFSDRNGDYRDAENAFKARFSAKPKPLPIPKGSPKTAEEAPVSTRNSRVSWKRTSKNGYEVSTAGDRRFSALVAKFSEDVTIEGITIPKGTTIEDAYQHYIKKSGKGRTPSKDSILYREGAYTKELQEDFSYEKGYLPLWLAWASLHPKLMSELADRTLGKTLTDKYASTRVSQARALADILNSNTESKTLEKISNDDDRPVSRPNVIRTHKGNWTREEVKNNSDTLYIFTDNTDRDSGKSLIDDNSRYAKKYGKGKHFPTMTAAVVRGLDNAFPISTLRWYHEGAKGTTGRWTDKDVEEFEKTIKDEIDDIISEWNTGNYKSIMIPSGDGFFNSNIANISKERTPELYRILKEQLDRLYSAVGESNTEVSSSEKISDDSEQYTEEEKKEVVKGRQRAKSLSVILGGLHNADAIWKTFGKYYGIEQMSAVENIEEVWEKEVSIDDKRRLGELYRRACEEMSRKPQGLDREKVLRIWAREGRILERLSIWLAMLASSVYLIADIIYPGEEITNEKNAHAKYTNNSSIPQVIGPRGFAAWYAIEQGKPVHVFDTRQEKWFTWSKELNTYVEESTPKLLNNAFLSGKYMHGKWQQSYISAVHNLFRKSFGYRAIGYKRWGQDVSKLGDSMQEVIKAALKYKESTEGMEIDSDSSRALLLRAFTPVVRSARVDMLSTIFSRVIDDILLEDKKNIYNELAKDYDDITIYKSVLLDKNASKEDKKEARKNLNDVFRRNNKNKKYRDILLGSDLLLLRQMAISRHKLEGEDDSIFNRMIALLKKNQDKAETQEVKDKFLLVIDHFNALMEEAIENIEEIENIRLVQEKPKKSSADLQIEDEDNDPNSGRMFGNDGWNYKVRFVNPKSTLTTLVKRLLNNVPRTDKNGWYVRDDLGFMINMNGAVTYNILINELSEMIDAEDFFKVVGRDEDGTPQYEFPLLEKLSVKYPWVQDIIETLESDPLTASLFFRGFNKAYIQYTETAKGNEKTKKGSVTRLNAPIARNAAYQQVVQNYEHRLILTDTSKESLFNETGEIQKDVAKTIADLALKLRRNIEDLRDSVALNNVEEINKYGEDLTKLLRGLGFNSNVDYITKALPLLVESKDDISQLSRLLSNIITITLEISNPKKNAKKVWGDDKVYTEFFSELLKNIAAIIGEMNEFDNMMSVKDGNNSRYAYSAPSYSINLVKLIKKNGKEFIDAEFGYDGFFKDSFGLYLNLWLEDWTRLDDEGRLLRQELLLYEHLNSRDSLGNPVPYSEWTPSMVYLVLFDLYFSRLTENTEGILLANYNFPIFSDSPVVMFITGRAYRDNHTQTFEELMAPLFRKLIKLELKRIKRVQLREKLDADYKISEYDSKRGHEFCFFPELNNLAFRVDDGNLSIIPTEEIEKRLDKQLALNEVLFKDLLNVHWTTAFTIDEIIDMAMNHIMNNLYKEFLSDINLKEISKITSLFEEKSPEEVNRMLKEFFWNSTFASSQIILIMTTDLAFYKHTTDFTKRFKEVYASGDRLNTLSKYGRIMENTIYIEDAVLTSYRYVLTKAALTRMYEEGRISESLYNQILKGLKDINVADALAFRNPYAMRAVLDMMGKWNDELDECFERILSGEFDLGDLAMIFQIIKPFMFANVRTDDGLGGEMRVPHLNKNSEFVVLAFYDMISAATGNSKFLKGIGQFFNKHKNIDLILFKSAVKTGLSGKVNLNSSLERIDKLIYKFNSKGEKDGLTEEGKIIVNAVRALEGNPDAINHNLLKEALDFILDSNVETINGKSLLDFYIDCWEAIQLTPNEIVEELETTIRTKDGQLDTDNEVFNKQVVHLLPYSAYMIAQPTPGHLIDEHEATSGSQFANLVLANLPEGFTCKLKDPITGKIREFNKAALQTLYGAATVDNILDDFERLKLLFDVSNIRDLQSRLLETMRGNPKFGPDIKAALLIVTVTDKNGNKYETFNLPLDLPTITLLVQELVLSTFKNHITKRKINGGSAILVAGVGFSKHLLILRDSDNNIIGAECYLPAWSEAFFSSYLKEVTKEVHTKEGIKKITYLELDINAVPDELKEMIGYRIPTEGKCSMLPLIVKGFMPQLSGTGIMLPIEITLIAGSDFDVDKMFLRIPAFELDEDGMPQKIRYSLDGDPSKMTASMSKEQRDNLMIDIERAVLTSLTGSEQIFHPSLFNTLRRALKEALIMLTSYLLEKFIEIFGRGNSVDYYVNNPETLLELIKGESTDALDSFVKNYQKQKNPLTPTTYTYYHLQNMLGSAMVGIYANAASIHTKTQNTNLRLSLPIRINGKALLSLAKLNNDEGELIQDNIAEFQGASVDNAKELLLADLGLNTKTSGTSNLLTRLGVTIEETGLIFLALQHYDKDVLKKINKLLGIKKVNLETDSELLARVSLWENRYHILQHFKNAQEGGATQWAEILQYISEQIGLGMDTINDYLYTVANNFNLFEHILKCKKELREVNNIMKPDSPNNGPAITIAELSAQIILVNMVNRRLCNKRSTLRGISDIASDTPNEIIKNGVITRHDSRETMRKKLLDSRLPVLQAFYSLGIEMPMSVISPHFFLGNEALMQAMDDIMTLGSGEWSPIMINTFHRDFMLFILSNTQLFGEDFAVKREYYLTQFPLKIRKIIAKHSELRSNPSIQRLFVYNPEYPYIGFNKPSGLSAMQKRAIMRDFASLLYSENEEVVEFAKGLFMYSFFKDGFFFGPRSYGTYLDDNYWTAFPEVLLFLRTIKSDVVITEELIDRFKELLIANHGSKGNYLRTPLEWDLGDKKDEIIVPFKYVDNYKYNDDSAWTQVTYIKIPNGESYDIYRTVAGSWKGGRNGTVVYRKVSKFDEPISVYDSNHEKDELARVYFNDRAKIAKEKKKKGIETTSVETPQNKPKSNKEVIDYDLTNIRMAPEQEELDPEAQYGGMDLGAEPNDDVDIESMYSGFAFLNDDIDDTISEPDIDTSKITDEDIDLATDNTNGCNK